MTNETSIVRPKEVARMLGVAVSTLGKMRRNGAFPVPIRLTNDGRRAAVGWRRSTIENWLAGREASQGGQ